MRRNFSRAIIKEARARANGHCERCNQLFGPHNPPEAHHITADWEGGEPVLSNALCVGRKCCHEYLSAKDTRRRAKADRQGAVHFGTKRRTARPLPGSRASGLRKRMNGQVEKW